MTVLGKHGLAGPLGVVIKGKLSTQAIRSRLAELFSFLGVVWLRDLPGDVSGERMVVDAWQSGFPVWVDLNLLADLAGQVDIYGELGVAVFVLPLAVVEDGQLSAVMDALSRLNLSRHPAERAAVYGSLPGVGTAGLHSCVQLGWAGGIRGFVCTPAQLSFFRSRRGPVVEVAVLMDDSTDPAEMIGGGANLLMMDLKTAEAARVVLEALARDEKRMVLLRRAS